MIDSVPNVDCSSTRADGSECEPTLAERVLVDSAETWGTLLEGFRHQLTDQVVRRIDRRLRSKICACDVVQETFLRALHYRHTFRGLTKPELASWLRTILDSRLNEHFKHFRAQRRDVTREVPLEANPELARLELRLCEILGLAADFRLAKLERAERVAAALRKLPARYRVAVVARNVDGLSLAAVAAQYGWTTHSTQKYIRRGLNKLAELLAEFDPARD